MKKKIVCLLLLLILSMIIGTVCPGLYHAAESSAGTEPLTAIEVPFLNGVRHVTYQWNFPYSDDFFRQSSGIFSIETARASLGLTVSAFRNNNELIEDHYETYLKEAGFRDIYAYGYDR